MTELDAPFPDGWLPPFPIGFAFFCLSLLSLHSLALARRGQRALSLEPGEDQWLLRHLLFEKVLMLRDFRRARSGLGARSRRACGHVCAVAVLCRPPRAMCTYICTHGMRVFCGPLNLGVMRVFYIALNAAVRPRTSGKVRIAASRHGGPGHTLRRPGALLMRSVGCLLADCCGVINPRAARTSSEHPTVLRTRRKALWCVSALGALGRSLYLSTAVWC